MPDVPSISILITSYNDGSFLDESVGSAVDLCTATSHPANFEIVLADDGSTERRTVEVLDRLERRGIRVVRFPHRGIGATRNAGVHATHGAWFVPLDADNRLRPSMIDQLLPMALTNPQAGMVYGDAMRFGLRTGEWIMGPTDLERIWRENHIDSCALIRRSAWAEVGGYSNRFNGLEDWDLWLRFIERGLELTYVSGITFDYRVRPDSLISLRRSRFFAYRQTPLTERGLVTNERTNA